MTFSVTPARLGVLFGLSFSACASSDAVPAGRADAGHAMDPAVLSDDAFVWGFPLVVTERTLQTLGSLIGTNTLFNQTALSDASTPRIIVAPNQDTLYSVAVLDLRSEPMVLAVPDVHDRYWTYQFLDAWTNSFHYIGTRATGGVGGTFVITPPGFSGALPPGTTEIRSPTPTLFLLGRYLVRDAADATNVTALVRTLAPLHVVTGKPAPTPPTPLGPPPGKPQETGNDGASFFDELGDALAVNPPANDFDRSELERFAPLGIGAGRHPATEAHDQDLLAAFEAGIASGNARISDAIDSSGISKNGWTAHLDIGVYDADSLLRAAVSRFGWGANVPEEAVYPISQKDPAGNPYSGKRAYVLHFDAGALPPLDPASGFWSLTLYGPDRFFVENEIKRYAIGDRTQGLTFNADGSLDIFVQSTKPAATGNWLPAPASFPDAGANGDFILLLRLYLPQKSVLDGSYVYPGVVPQ